MAKTKIRLNGKEIVLDMDRPGVADAVAKLIMLASERKFAIGDMYDHENGHEYQLVRIKQSNGTFRAYLINTDTGIARNSRKVVLVQEPKVDGGYVTDLPAEMDKFYDPEGDGFIVC